MGGFSLEGISLGTKPTFPLTNYTPSNITSKYIGTGGANIENQSQINVSGCFQAGLKQG